MIDDLDGMTRLVPERAVRNRDRIEGRNAMHIAIKRTVRDHRNTIEIVNGEDADVELREHTIIKQAVRRYTESSTRARAYKCEASNGVVRRAKPGKIATAVDDRRCRTVAAAHRQMAQDSFPRQCWYRCRSWLTQCQHWHRTPFG